MRSLQSVCFVGKVNTGGLPARFFSFGTLRQGRGRKPDLPWSPSRHQGSVMTLSTNNTVQMARSPRAAVEGHWWPPLRTNWFNKLSFVIRNIHLWVQSQGDCNEFSRRWGFGGNPMGAAHTDTETLSGLWSPGAGIQIWRFHASVRLQARLIFQSVTLQVLKGACTTFTFTAAMPRTAPFSWLELNPTRPACF